MLTKSYTDIIKEAASLEEFSVSNVVEDELKHACRECIKDIPVVSKEVVGYSASLVPVFANEGAYYIDLPDLVKYMDSTEVSDIKEAMEDVAEANNLSVEEMSLVLESREYMESVIESAAEISKAGDATMLEECELAVKFINMLISEGINVVLKTK